jgi:hypothetical protein
LLTRSIEFDDRQTIEQTVFRNAKRACVVVAVIALGVGALDLIQAGARDGASQVAHERRVSLAALPAWALTGLRKIDIGTSAPDEQVAVTIPREVDTRAERPAATAEHAPTPVPFALDELAAAARKSAVELAMVAPALADTPAAPLQVASLDTTDVASESSQSFTSISLPERLAVLPPPAPGVPPPSPIERLHLTGKTLARAERCLANAIYFEARDQPYKGQVAVAQVVMNRVFSGFYPEDVCGVIYQNADRHLACQFTFACDGKRKVINERGAWARANRIARETLAGKLYESAVGTATHYHALYVHPYWTRQMHKLVRYGIHSFYRPIAWGSGADEPVWSKLALKKKKD